MPCLHADDSCDLLSCLLTRSREVFVWDERVEEGGIGASSPGGVRSEGGPPVFGEVGAGSGGGFEGEGVVGLALPPTTSRPTSLSVSDGRRVVVAELEQEQTRRAIGSNRNASPTLVTFSGVDLFSSSTSAGATSQTAGACAITPPPRRGSSTEGAVPYRVPKLPVRSQLSPRAFHHHQPSPYRHHVEGQRERAAQAGP